MAMEVLAKKGLEEAKKQKRIAEQAKKVEKEKRILDGIRKRAEMNGGPSAKNLSEIKYQARALEKASKELDRLKK